MSQIVLYEHAGFQGQTIQLTESCPDLRKMHFNDKVSSIEVVSGSWKVCEHIEYSGKSWVIGPGRYDLLTIHENIGNDAISSVQTAESITLFEHAGFSGRDLELHKSTPNFVPLGFNDKASSIKVASGTWIVYEHINYEGKYWEIGPGEYDIKVLHEKIGNDVISSVKLLPLPCITLFEHKGFSGRELKLHKSTSNFIPLGFNDKASSIKITSGTWIVYENIDYDGQHWEIGPGSYDLNILQQSIGNETISSACLKKVGF